jgi:Asp-tRNA(Asn)/Glu-tRNA(Gln) amidotransferase A subunit family amidase
VRDVDCRQGVGGDIGGSIRCPAANVGVYGFKPTPFRMGKMGSVAAVAGQEGYVFYTLSLSPSLLTHP